MLRASLYEMMYVDARQGRSPESASCLALEASPLHKMWKIDRAKSLLWKSFEREQLSRFLLSQPLQALRRRSPLLGIPMLGNELNTNGWRGNGGSFRVTVFDEAKKNKKAYKYTLLLQIVA